jgi:hypothetical protein
LPNLGTSLATRRRSLLYFYQLRRPSLNSISFYFSSFWDYLGFSISLFELSRDNNDNFSLTTRPSPTLTLDSTLIGTLDLGYRNGFRLSSRRTYLGREGRSGYPYTHIITSARSHPRLIGPGLCPGGITGSPMDAPATGRWRSAILLLLLGLSISLSLFGFYGISIYDPMSCPYIVNVPY